MGKSIIGSMKVVGAGKAVFNMSSSSSFWEFILPAPGTVLSNFKVVYTGNPVTVDWGDGQKQVLTSNINYNHTY